MAGYSTFSGATDLISGAAQSIADRLWKLIDSPFTNGLNQINRIGGAEDVGYDPQRPWASPFQNAGYPDPIAQGLGIAASLAVPGAVGMGVERAFGGARAIAASGDASRTTGNAARTARAPVMDPQTGRPLTALRAEGANGLGPIGVDAQNIGAGRYWTTDPAYVDGLAARPSTARVVQSQFSARPDQVLNALPGAANNADMMGRLGRQVLDEAARRNLPQGQVDFLVRSLGEARDGTRSVTDLIRDLESVFPGQSGALRNSADIPLTLQYLDDGRNVGAATEAVVTNPDVLRPMNVLDPKEFRAAYGQTEQALSLASDLRTQPRGFRSLRPNEVSGYTDAVSSMDPSKAGFLTPTTPEQLAQRVSGGDRVFMNQDRVGYILSKDGDLQGVINPSGIRGAGKGAIQDAIDRGAVSLDAFDGFLPDYYRQFGFQETGRVPFDPQYAPPNWDYQKYGTPDVVFMRLKGR